ncbi:MAG: hypothetical protein ACPG77_12285 [Nannocystaceae bacterium]
MNCPVDPELWALDNRVTLHPGRVNRWVLVRTLRDNPTPELLLRSTIAVMGRWFGDSGIGITTGTAGDNVDSIAIESQSYTRPLLMNSQRREQLDPIPMMRPGSVIYLTVTFNYRGSIRSMPWPVWSSAFSLLTSSKICPFNCDWMLSEAANTSTSGGELPAVREPDSWWEQVAEYSKGSPLGAIQSGVKFIATAAMLIAGLWAFRTIYRPSHKRLQ